MRTLQRELYRSLTVVVLAVSPASAQQTPRLEFGGAIFRSASGDSVAVDTATLFVPENRRDRRSRQIAVAVVRFRGQESGVPLVYISGGGGSGISAAGGPRFPFFLGLRELGDVIVFDVRGTGRSTPRLACNAGLGLDMSQPLTRAALVSATRRVNRTCADSLRAQGFDLAGYNGRELVADIEDLRRALDVPRLRLFGTSTGTHLALEYVRAHPRRVAVAILAGTEGPGQTVHLPSDLDSTLVRIAARSPAVPLLELTSGVFAALDSQPVHVDVRGSMVAMGGYDARVFVAAAMGDRNQQKQLPQLLGALRAGAVAPLAGLKVQALNAPFQSPWESLHDCQAGSAADRTRLVTQQAATALLGDATLDFPDACDGWGVRELPDRYRSPVRANVPVLFISGTLDGRTPVRNAEEVRRGFRVSAHLILDGASHGDDLFIAAPEILEAVLSFARAPAAATRTVRIE